MLVAIEATTGLMLQNEGIKYNIDSNGAYMYLTSEKIEYLLIHFNEVTIHSLNRFGVVYTDRERLLIEKGFDGILEVG